MKACDTVLFVCLLALPSVAQQGVLDSHGVDAAPERQQRDQSGYVLGPGDQVSIRVVDADEIDKPVQIDTSGYLHLPMAGRMRVAGLTVEQLEAELTARLKPYLVQPDVSVSVSTFRSQPVSVVGAVRTPGVYQVEGRKTLIEMLSVAGGLDSAAGSRLTITRRLTWGRIPLKGAADDPGRHFSVASLDVNSILQSRDPEENIEVRPYDVISVPRAQMVYVIGDVQKAGGFALADHERMTVLQALSLAGGLDRTAAPKRARILRAGAQGRDREEIPVDVQRILEGHASDFQMRADDILFIPNSTSKRAAVRAAEAAIQIGTGVVIWRR